MCFYVDEECSIYEESIRKARKPHRCDECGGPISAGELYVFGHGVFDGSGFSIKICGACESTRHRIHLHELAEGCKWHESWCPHRELLDYCAESGFARSTEADGQKFLQDKKATRKDTQ